MVKSMINKKRYDRDYYIKNEERLKEYHKKYHLKNRDKILEYQKRYCLKNPEKIKERSRLYYIQNKEKIREYYKEHREEKKEKLKKHFEQYCKEHHKEALEINQHITNLSGDCRNQFLKLGEYFEKIKKRNLYKVLNFETFKEYIKQPEIKMKKSTAYALIDIWRTFVKNRNYEISFLQKIGYPKLSKLRLIINYPEFKECLSLANILNYNKLYEEIKRIKTGEYPNVSQEMYKEELKNMGIGKCVICGEKKSLIEHHICYKPHYSILICRNCHQLCHRQVTQINNKREGNHEKRVNI